MSDAQSRDEERAARLAAQRKAWNDAHPSYYAEYRDRNREEIRRKNREYMRDQAQRERDEGSPAQPERPADAAEDPGSFDVWDVNLHLCGLPGLAVSA